MLGPLTQWNSNHITKDMNPLQQCSQNILFQGHCLQLTHLVPSLVKQLPRKCSDLSAVMTRQLVGWLLKQSRSQHSITAAILTLEKRGSIIPVSKTLTLQGVHLQLRSLWTLLKQYMFGGMCKELRLLPPCLLTLHKPPANYHSMLQSTRSLCSATKMVSLLLMSLTAAASLSVQSQTFSSRLLLLSWTISISFMTGVINSLHFCSSW